MRPVDDHLHMRRRPRQESMLPEPSSPVLADMSQLLASLPSSPDSPTCQRSPTATLRGTAPAAAAEDADQTPGVRQVSSKQMVRLATPSYSCSCLARMSL